MDLSVVIPARDGAGSLPPLLESLAAQTLARERFEVIVVDNASSDDTAGVARAHGARVVHEPVANRSRARNTGAAAARAELLAFTDADCVADPGWLEALLRCAERGALVAGRVVTTTAEPPNLVERYERLWRFSQEAWVRSGWAATANLLVRRAAFADAGGFDPTWRHIGEDVDFCLRARDAGHDLGYCAEAVILHDAEREWWPLLKRSYRHGYSVNQAYHRLGLGYRAWRRPQPMVHGDEALTVNGVRRDGFEATEWRRLLAVARLSYGARVVGSVWAELTRAR